MEEKKKKSRKETLQQKCAEITNPLLDVSTRGRSNWYRINKLRAPIDRMKMDESMKNFKFDPSGPFE